MYRVWNFITSYSLFLIGGAILALIWANTNPAAYHHFVDFVIVDDFFIGHLHDDGHGHVTRTLTLHYLVNDVLMAFFFAIAAKEVWEAVILENGSLRGRKAATPLFATLGGMLGPITVYLGLAMIMGSETYDAVANGWAIPTATDIAFSYLVGRMVFGAGLMMSAARSCVRSGFFSSMRRRSPSVTMPATRSSSSTTVQPRRFAVISRMVRGRSSDSCTAGRSFCGYRSLTRR